MKRMVIGPLAKVTDRTPPAERASEGFPRGFQRGMALRIGIDGRVLADPRMRGWARYTVNLLRALSEIRDIELVLFCVQEPWPEHLKGINAKVITFCAPREFIWNDWALPRMIRQERVGLFHAPTDRGLPLIKPCPMVVTVHDSYERTYWRTLLPTVKKKIWYWKHECVNYCLSDAVLTVSETTRKDLIRLNVAPKRKLHSIYLAPSGEFHPGPCARDEMVIRRYGLNGPYILYVGGYDLRKNVDTLVQAFNQADLPKHSLVIVAAHQWEYAKLVEGWKELQCFPRLRLLEAATQDIPALYRHADFFVNPSLWESFSFQLVEAMACGTPILASNRKAIPEITDTAALLFDPEDTGTLSKLMESVARDSALKEGLRAKGFERVKAFSWHKTAVETVRIYRDILAKSAR
jgi:glycosyltransferase involved in cell wall biosynthesis